MNELEHLSEKDLEYFKKQQAEGKPVKIIYLDPDVLAELSFEDIEKMDREARENRSQLSEEEMEEWLRRHNAVLDESEKSQNKDPENHGGEADGENR